jgi:hypothetical protein
MKDEGAPKEPNPPREHKEYREKDPKADTK